MSTGTSSAASSGHAKCGYRALFRFRNAGAWCFIGLVIVTLMLGVRAARAEEVQEFQPNWTKPTTIVNTALAMEVCVEPPMRREKRTHDALYHTLSDLKGDHSRLAFWFPYPKLAVAELEPPTTDKVSWNFALLDPIVIDFMKAANGRPVMVNFSTIPEWMFKTAERVGYPEDPDAIDFRYGEKGTELRDPSLQEVRDYFVRLVSWYTRGGFTDEHGQRHESGYHFKFDTWEVLNEVDLEHHLSPQLYTRIYDEVVGALKKLDPQMKFSGPAFAQPRLGAEFFEYFLNPTNHKPGIPIDFVSYHFYAGPEHDESPEVQQHTFFALTDGFVTNARYIELIRKRLSPGTKTYVNELGTFSTDNFSPAEKIPEAYWSLSAATFAYGYLALSRLQIDLIAGAELINYPGQFPGASLTDWNTGLPNARYYVLKLLHDQINPGDSMVTEAVRDHYDTSLRYFDAQGFLSPDGARKVLIVNKRNRALRLHIPGIKGSRLDYMDIETGSQPPKNRRIDSDTVDLAGYTVAVVHLAQ
jgi:hypothetical protein